MARKQPTKCSVCGMGELAKLNFDEKLREHICDSCYAWQLRCMAALLRDNSLRGHIQRIRMIAED